jgi:hypothetical protein
MQVASQIESSAISTNQERSNGKCQPDNQSEENHSCPAHRRALSVKGRRAKSRATRMKRGILFFLLFGLLD